jgi:P pilus assembly chaperone PapD
MKKLLLLLITSNLLLAINLIPMTETLTTKKKKNIIFKVSNPTDEPVAVNFSVFKVVNNENHKEKRENTNSVQAYPTQFVLSPKETKSVRVRYMDKTLPELEEIYRIIAQELDIDVSDKKEEETNGEIKAKIKMRFSYEGILFVHKKNAKPILEVQSIKQNINSITLTISNSGTASDLPNIEDYDYFVILKDGKEYSLNKADLKGAEFRRVLAGKTNTFHLKHITSVPVDKIESMRLEKK